MEKPTVKTVKYENGTGINGVCEIIDAGYKVVCPICKSELIVALDKESSKKYKTHPGIFCPKDSKHVMILAEIDRRDFWKKVNENIKELEVEKQSHK